MPSFRADQLDTRIRPPLEASRHGLFVAAVVLASAGLLFLAAAAGHLATARYLFPVVATISAAAMLWLRPTWYVGFVWWVWILSPLVRRILDWQLGYLAVNPVQVTPFAVAGLSAVAVLARPSVLLRRRYWPFLAAAAGLLLAYGVGLVRYGIPGPTFRLLEYAAPLAFGLFLSSRPRALDELYRPLLVTFVIAGGFSAVYGVMQFFWIAPWDRAWMVASEAYPTRYIDPGRFRIFGTLNSTHPFGYVMVAGLTLLLGGRSLKSLPVSAPLVAGLLLSWTRAAWGAWIVSVLVAFAASSGHTRAVIGRIALVGSVTVVLLLLAGPLGSRIATRMDTLAELDEDISLRRRTNLYTNRAFEFLASPEGTGLGAAGKAAKLTTGDTVSIDSGYIALPYEFGWLGAALFFYGLGSLLVVIVRGRNPQDPRYAALIGGVAGLLAAGFFVNAFDGVHALILWTFVGTAFASLPDRNPVRD